MTNYEKVFEEAIGNFGLITSAQAVGIGVSNKELVKLASRGRLTRIGQGTYKLVQYAPAAAIMGRLRAAFCVCA